MGRYWSFDRYADRTGKQVQMHNLPDRTNMIIPIFKPGDTLSDLIEVIDSYDQSEGIKDKQISGSFLEYVIEEYLQVALIDIASVGVSLDKKDENDKHKLEEDATYSVKEDLRNRIRDQGKVSEVLELVKERLAQEIKIFNDEAEALTESKKNKGHCDEEPYVPSMWREEILGLQESPEAYVIFPDFFEAAEFDLDLFRKSDYRIEGKWYPFEFRLRQGTSETIFILDDDGSIYVSLEGKSEEERLMIMRQSKQLANLIYSR